jgi:CubicO group peptidase (beta-lactamase class C family)
VLGVAQQPLVVDEFGGVLSALARRHHIPGAQLAIHQAGRTQAFEVGELEHGGGVKVTPDAAFPVGSIGKVFTATTAMILVDDGDLELDAPISEQLPELDDAIGRLSLEQLLSHTGGLAANPPEAADGVSLRRYVTEHCGPETAIMSPGVAFSYSNPGYLLVGRLIEATTGMTWNEAVESILLRPMGIAPAFVGHWQPPAGRPVASGHSANVATGRVRPVGQSLQPAEVPAGGLAMSALDLIAYGRLHLDGDGPLPAEYAERMRRPVPDAEPFGLADGWGLGLAVFRAAGRTWVGHDGNADGTACYLRVDVENGCVVGLTTNANTGIGMWTELQAELAAAGLPIGGAAPQAGQPSTPPADCVGIYTNGEIEYVVSADDSGVVTLAVGGDTAERLTVHEGLTFWLDDLATGRPEFGGRFLRDSTTGKVTGLQMGGRLAPRRS